MANPYYTYSGAFIPGTLARAEAETTEFGLVQAGFAILAIQGTDSGAANAYVVTTNGGPTAAYVDGNIVEFKAAAANTGSSTINVNGIGAVGLTSSTGQALASGAISANTWYRALYNSTYSAWTIVAPTSLVTTSNTISAAAPTNKVGLTAAGGVSTAVAPIDATYALDVSIVPTWTGAHTFSNTVTFNSTVTFATGLSLTGGSGAYAATLTGSSSAGNSRGLLIKAGVNASDIALLIQSQNGGTTFVNVGGTGGVQIGSPTGGDKGVGTINAQALYVNNAAVLTSAASSANPSATIGLAAVNGVAATFMTSDSAPALSQAIVPTWTAAHVFTPGSAVVAVTMNAAVNTVGLQVTGSTNNSLSYLVQFATAQGSGFSSGLLLKAGTTSADNAILIQNAAANATRFQIKGDGSGSLGVSATTGMQWTTTGAHTINATAANCLSVQLSASSIFVVSDKTAPVIQGWGPTAAALVDMTPDASSFTGTLTGFTSANTGTVKWRRMGSFVTLYTEADMIGTSNTTAMTMTGVPAALQPSATRFGHCVNVQDSSSTTPDFPAVFSITAGTITFYGSVAANTGNKPSFGTTQFASSGSKGLHAGWQISYQL